ncbi:MAG: preprotein translocase subunit SecG [Azoarcus sp.]|jgi:preprotein translocase subunit SecG|nr:preprotein translocase subunit SecG [Azoarcus sp.]
MNGMIFSMVLAVHVVVGLGVIALVLMQHGKGADAGAAFGSGASGSLFGASGSANFLSRTTAVLATVFFLTSLGLSFLASKQPTGPASIVDSIEIQPSPAPAANDVPAPAEGAGEQVAPGTQAVPEGVQAIPE